MTKARITSQAREVCAQAREMMGGNGILIENRAIKAMMDIEGVHTYEGTYEINTLICGGEITGISAFK
jgi:glutaryl-CoA dehydrogenase